MLAAGSGDIGITRALLHRGADPGTVCRPGKTALVVAIERGYSALVELLKRALDQATPGKPKSLQANVESPGKGVARAITR